jgi:hypothetical protein
MGCGAKERERIMKLPFYTNFRSHYHFTEIKSFVEESNGLEASRSE